MTLGSYKDKLLIIFILIIYCAVCHLHFISHYLSLDCLRNDL